MSEKNAKTPVSGVGKGNDITPVPMYVAIAYWSFCAQQKNPLASALIQALASGHLLTLLDDAYGVQRSPEERQEAMLDLLHSDSTEACQMAAQIQKRALQSARSSTWARFP